VQRMSAESSKSLLARVPLLVGVAKAGRRRGVRGLRVVKNGGGVHGSLPVIDDSPAFEVIGDTMPGATLWKELSAESDICGDRPRVSALASITFSRCVRRKAALGLVEERTGLLRIAP
jgi:hypothetical protein